MAKIPQRRVPFHLPAPKPLSESRKSRKKSTFDDADQSMGPTSRLPASELHKITEVSKKHINPLPSHFIFFFFNYSSNTFDTAIDCFFISTSSALFELSSSFYNTLLLFFFLFFLFFLSQNGRRISRQTRKACDGEDSPRLLPPTLHACRGGGPSSGSSLAR